MKRSAFDQIVGTVLVLFAAALWLIPVFFALLWIAANRLLGRRIDLPKFPAIRPGRA